MPPFRKGSPAMRNDTYVRVGLLAAFAVFCIIAGYRLIFPKKYIYGLMIDAGSTGSRIHTFIFSENEDRSFDLVKEDFYAIKPGLSAYKDDVEKAGPSLVPLLERAKRIVPLKLQKKTPVFLRATAGLRLTGEDTAEKILASARKTLSESGFRFDGSDWAKVMSGNDEGIFSWITVNYLLGKDRQSTVGTLEMGGGSSQIAFVPDQAITADCKEKEQIETIPYKGGELPLYTFSHLGYGIKKAKSTMMTYFKENGFGDNNPCLSKGQQEVQVPFEATTLTMTGSGDWQQCADLVAKVMGPKTTRCPCGICTYGDKTQPKPIREYYAFAFYMERTINIGLKSPLTLKDIRKKGEEVCPMSIQDVNEKYPKIPNGAASELCFDLAFIYAHLRNGHGLPESEKESDVKITVVDKIGGVELGWALGAMFNELSKLRSAHTGE